MSATVMKVEIEAEVCSICGGGGDLMTPEEHDAGAPPMQVPLRAMLLHLNNSKVIPEGKLCSSCIRRTLEAYEFSTALSSKAVPPLSEKIRALRRRLHELTQKIDVFIVVGGAQGNAYSEDDIIMVERGALAAAAAADDVDMERARNARGDTVYQCSVCPSSFQRISEYRTHCSAHSADSVHNCWTCGAQFATRNALKEHSALHAPVQALTCHLCNTSFQSASELSAHEISCPPYCPACGTRFPDRRSLSTHVAASHGRTGDGPYVCGVCFLVLPSASLLIAHAQAHRQPAHYVCGYRACILRFATRSNLMAHIRKCHNTEAPEQIEQVEQAMPSTTCEQCGRTFGSVAAMKRHSRVHRSNRTELQEQGEEVEDTPGEVEYLELETLDDMGYHDNDEMDVKPQLSL